MDAENRNFQKGKSIRCPGSLTHLDVNNFSHQLRVEERVWRNEVRWTWTKSKHDASSFDYSWDESKTSGVGGSFSRTK